MHKINLEKHIVKITFHLKEWSKGDVDLFLRIAN